MNQKLEDLLQLALQTPEEVRARTEELNVGFNENMRTWELIVKYHGSLDGLEALNIQVEYLIAGYAILTVPELFVESIAELEEIEYVEKPKRYFYGVEMPADGSCIAPVTLREPNLSGSGVLIAVLDSGIDFNLPEFRNRDGSTRIRYLWDQTLRADMFLAAGTGNGGASGSAESQSAGAGMTLGEDGGTGNGSEEYAWKPPAGFRMGVEFNAAQINRALAIADSQQQFRILPSVDTSGHGTAVAGIAAGNSLQYQGVAPEADFLIVKLGLPDVSSFPRTTEIMRAVTYTVHKAVEMQMPVVINLSFGNTYGAHDGSSLLERFLDNA